MCIFSLALMPAFASYTHFTLEKSAGNFTGKSLPDNKSTAAHHSCCHTTIAHIFSPVLGNFTLLAVENFHLDMDSFKNSRNVGPPLEPPTFS